MFGAKEVKRVPIIQQGSSDNLLLVKNSMARTTEELELINEYLASFEFLSTKGKPIERNSSIVPIKETPYCGMLARDIEGNMRRARLAIERRSAII